MKMGGLHPFKSRGSSTAAPADVSVDVPLNVRILDEINKGSVLSVIRLVDLLIESACAARASDVHFDPRAEGVMVRLRIDGLLQDMHLLPASIHAEVISRIKILSGLRIDEHQAAQDGRFQANLIEGRTVDVRVSIVPTHYGENAVLRLLSGQHGLFVLENLGLTARNRERILHALKKPFGMVLATGPTGSGKTTTLYTLLNLLNRSDTSIITIEDPIEYSLAGVNQIPINPRTGLTFANGLRSILRQDPNVIMVGEIRDEETAGLAINTALTGHTVLSTLHTNDAPTTLPRLLDMGVEPYLIASTVSVAIGQRLVRRICEACKEECVVSDVEIASIPEDLRDELLHGKAKFYRGNGCVACAGTGYHGRIGIHEVLEMNTQVREGILRKASANEIRTIAIQTGMTPLFADGMRKATRGITTIEEVLRTRHE